MSAGLADIKGKEWETNIVVFLNVTKENETE